jgi:prophage regulatory protein
MSEERLLRLPMVESLTGYKRAHLYNLVRNGKFPRPLKIGLRASAWQASEVQAWIAERIREAKEDQR